MHGIIAGVLFMLWVAYEETKRPPPPPPRH